MKTLTCRLEDEVFHQFKVRCAVVRRPQAHVLDELVRGFLGAEFTPAPPRPVSEKVQEALHELGHDAMDTEF
jgi:hypothetical protein